MDDFIGLDGYPGGWVAVFLSASIAKVDYLDHISALQKYKFTTAMIDIPIGLPNFGYRNCDVAARHLLGKSRSRVFLGARRFVLDCVTQEEANEKARLKSDKGISAQLFCLSPKLAEVDKFRRKTDLPILECHPELVFWRLNGERNLPSKKTGQGIVARCAILEKEGFLNLDALLQTRIGKGAKADDIIDACACAIAAKDKNPGRPPLGGDMDDEGLKMEIHY